MRKLLPLLLLFFIAIPTLAQNRVAGQQSNNDRLLNQPINPRSIRIQVTADLFIATTFIEMEFYNAGNREIEGLYYFNLDPGQAITSFQLDLHGKFRDGTIEDRGKATGAYNAIVGKRIDPALLSMYSANSFSLNIYPIAPQSSRRITFTIQQVLKAETDLLKYFLPLRSAVPVSSFDVSIRINNSPFQPFIDKGLLKGQLFNSVKGNHELKWKEENAMIEAGLAFSIPIDRQQPVVCTRTIEGRTFFAYRSRLSIPQQYKVNPKSLAVYWDVSINGKDRQHEKEIEFLKEYLKANPVKELKIIPFNHNLKQSRSFNLAGTGQDWVQFLKALEYEGATQFGNLDFSKQTTDQVFLFSSGWNSYGNDMPVPGNKQVYCINAAGYPNRPHLLKIIGTSGGSYIDLIRIPVIHAVRTASVAENKLVQINSSNKSIVLADEWSIYNGQEILVSGSIEGDAGEITIDFGNDERIASKETFRIAADNSCTESCIERLPTLAMYDSCIRSYNWDWTRNYGLEEGIVTPYTSYIVLERIEDYLRYNIKLPGDLEKECGMEPVVKHEKTRDGILTGVAKSYNQRIDWWDKNQAPIEVTKTEEFNSIARSVPGTGGLTGKVSGLAVNDTEQRSLNGESMMSEVVVTALGRTNQARELGYSVHKVRANELVQARPVNLQNGLTGKVSGLNVQTTNSGVFTDTRITLRGIRSLTGNNQPLLIMDGSLIPLRLISSINPNDILDVTILKSPAATAIYGPDGANGALSITTKKGRNYRYNYYNGVYKLKNCEEMDYIIEISQCISTEKMITFKKLEALYGNSSGFYYDMANHFFASRMPAEAVNILFSALGKGNGSRASLRAVAYTLESWKMFSEATKFYNDLLHTDSSDIHAWRDLALIHYQNGRMQLAVDILYSAIIRNWDEKENQMTNWKATLLQEMNAIIAVHGKSIDLSKINTSLIFPIPVDLRITVQCNKEGKNTIAILTPRKEELNVLKNSSDLIANEFQLKKAKKGKYTIRANYNDWNNYSYGAPTFYKIVSFKRFGSPDQTIEVENVIMDNQSGLVDIGEVKWH